MTVQRSQRMGRLLRDELNRLLRRGVKDPRLEGVSVTRVEVSADCRNARVLFTCLADQSGAEAAAEAFHRASGFLRSRMGRALRIRQVPELTYRHDRVLHEATEVRMLIDRLVDADRETQRARGELDEDGDDSGEDDGDEDDGDEADGDGADGDGADDTGAPEEES